MKKCTKCHKKKDLIEFYKDRYSSDNYSYQCKKCINAYRYLYCRTERGKEVSRNNSKLYRETVKGRLNHRKCMAKYRNSVKGKQNKKIYDKQYRKDHPRKKRTWWIFNNAIRQRKIKRKTHCDHCGINTKPHGHHPDYRKPLEVIWLCRYCHTKLHPSKLKKVI